ncbi:MAG: tryptophan-rich sensory protein [Thermoplasmata archaeon]|nr:tryptophan-rich sensory protein [Thermoplasmata archaeon]MBE3139163.1 tryptophan-rich sensory protein [Thermoplasmata archaeon]
MRIQWKKLAISMLISFLPGIVGSLFMIGSIDGWYATLNKPWFTPPNWVFGPVWTMLYILMGISLYLVWIKIHRDDVFVVSSLFGTQLAFNAIWTPIFFSVHAVLPSFIIIAGLWLLVFATIITFYKTSKNASYLLIPYIVWLTIATALNVGVLLLN